MAKVSNHRMLSLSQKVYGWLLHAYPSSHRLEYGPAMAQLFRDQSRDAWDEDKGWGMLKLWLRVLPDLVNTSIAEQFSAFNPRKTMSDKLSALFRPLTSPLLSFLTVFAIVFFLVFTTSVIITFLLPESYASTVRLKVEPDPSTNGKQMDDNPYFIQTTLEIIQSQVVLNPVIDKLKLNALWGKKHFAGETLRPPETLAILRKHLEVAPVRNTSLIAITAYSDNANEAAQIANAVAGSYRDYRTKKRAALMAKGIAVMENAYQQEKARIHQAQSDVESLGQKFKVPDVDASTPDELVQHFKKQLADGRRNYVELSAQLTTLKALKKDQLRDVLPNIVQDTTLNQLIDKWHNAKRNFTSLTNNYSLSAPKVLKVQSLENTLDRQINDRIAAILAGMKTQVNAKRAALDSLTAAIQSAKNAKPYWNKKRELRQLQSNHKLLYTKIEEEKIQAQIPQPLVQVTDRAEPGFRPAKPNKPLNLFIGAGTGGFLGMIAGMASAFFSLSLKKRRGTGASPV